MHWGRLSDFLEGGNGTLPGLKAILYDCCEVFEQGRETVNGEPVLGSFRPRFAQSFLGALRRGNHRSEQRLARTRVMVVKETRRKSLAHVPLDVIGKHT